LPKELVSPAIKYPARPISFLRNGIIEVSSTSQEKQKIGVYTRCQRWSEVHTHLKRAYIDCYLIVATTAAGKTATNKKPRQTPAQNWPQDKSFIKVLTKLHSHAEDIQGVEN
jgi:hypothetical protein